MPGFTPTGFTESGFVTVDPTPLSQSATFKYNSSQKGISFANDQFENVNKNIEVKLR